MKRPKDNIGLIKAPESRVYNMDCMEGMKEYPDGYFELAIVELATLTSKYLFSMYENIKRITGGKSGGVYGLCGLNYEGLCVLPVRAGVAIRRAIGRWAQAIKGSSQDNDGRSLNTATREGNEGVYLQHQTTREKKYQEVCKYGNRLVRFSLLGYADGRLLEERRYARNDQHPSGRFEGDVLRRTRKHQLSKSEVFGEHLELCPNSKRIEYARFAGLSDAPERIQAA